VVVVVVAAAAAAVSNNPRHEDKMILTIPFVNKTVMNFLTICLSSTLQHAVRYLNAATVILQYHSFPITKMHNAT